MLPRYSPSFCKKYAFSVQQVHTIMEADKHILTGSSQAWYIKDRTACVQNHALYGHAVIVLAWALVIIAHVKGLGMHAVCNMNHADCIF